MIVTFLDLLGFSWLVQNNPQSAYDNMINFNSIIKDKIIDAKTHPCGSYPVDMREFVTATYVTSFKYIISVSDSLIVGAEDSEAETFIKQLSTFVSAGAMRSLEPFCKPFKHLNDVKSNNYMGISKEGAIDYHNAFPMLFRGGISRGDKVLFFENPNYINDKACLAVNVIGENYIEAVQLESKSNIKGPRLLCKPNVFSSISNDIQSVVVPTDNSDIYEILWTYYACETDHCSSNKESNLNENGFEKLFSPTLGLYEYYLNKDVNIAEHYKEFLILIIKGMCLYAHKNSINMQQYKDMMLKRITNVVSNDKMKAYEDAFAFIGIEHIPT